MAADERETDGPTVPPLEHTAYFAIDRDDGYVRIEQSRGNQVLYTPAEARDVAESILEAADAAAAERPGSDE